MLKAMNWQPELFEFSPEILPGDRQEAPTLDLAVPQPLSDLLHVGTCSWKYDSWKGLLYRPGRKYGPFDYLPDYARHLNTVEIDQWF